MKYPIHYLTYILLCIGLQADPLKFESQLKEHTASFGAKEVLVDFHFTNTSDKPVTITKFDAPCKCMFATLEGGNKRKNGKVFEPGAKGVFKGRFVLEGFQGTIDKGIVIWLGDDDAKAPSIELVARVTVPVKFSISPTSLSWKKGGEAIEQTLTIKVNGDSPVKVQNFTCSSPNFKCKLITLKEGREYQVKVKPDSVKQSTMGILRLTTNSQVNKDKTIQAFLVVNQER